MKTITKIDEKHLKTQLDYAVSEIINEHIDNDGTYGLLEYLQDLLRGDCASGFVTELIYYADTEEFYKTHIDDIGRLLSETIEGIGDSPTDIFGEKWDKSDPLAVETANRNLLAWFAFEETARNLAGKMGIEI